MPAPRAFPDRWIVGQDFYVVPHSGSAAPDRWPLMQRAAWEGRVGKSISLALDEVRAVFRLVGECRELGHDTVLWHMRLAEGLVSLIHTQLVQAGVYRFVDGRPLDVRSINVGWPSEAVERSWEVWQRNPDMPDNPALNLFLAQPGTRVTCTNLDLLRPRDWNMAPFVMEFLCPNDIEHGMASRRPTTDGATHTLNLTRLRGDKPFGPRERTLVALLHDELEPHFGKTLATANDPVAQLTPRLRQALRCLLEGDSEKQIARRLGIAACTLHDHVKALYRHFHLGSRAELMAYFLKRGWKVL